MSFFPIFPFFILKIWKNDLMTYFPAYCRQQNQLIIRHPEQKRFMDQHFLGYGGLEKADMTDVEENLLSEQYQSL